MSSRYAKALRAASATALVLLAPGALHGGVAAEPADRRSHAALHAAGAGEGRDPDAPVYCVQAWTEARYRNYGYDHYVHVYNGCAVFATCQISTNVAPRPIKVRVKPGELKEVLTHRGAPSPDFVPRIRCVLDD